MTAIMAVIWANRELIAKIIGGMLLAFFCWWFFWHNPKVIKQLESEKVELSRQIVLRDNAINLLGTIERRHDAIDKGTNDNVGKIRTGRKPARTGYLLLDGMLPQVYQNYSAH